MATNKSKFGEGASTPHPHLWNLIMTITILLSKTTGLNLSKRVNSANYPILNYRYKDGPKGDKFPMFESLKLTIDRTLPYWNDVIVPQVCQFFLPEPFSSQFLKGLPKKSRPAGLGGVREQR
jgi:hypothetical protein